MQLIFSCNYGHLTSPSFQTLIPLYCSPIHYTCLHTQSYSLWQRMTDFQQDYSNGGNEVAQDCRWWVCLCMWLQCVLHVHCGPLEEPAPCEHPPWQLATLGRFVQLLSRSRTVVEQTCSGAWRSTHPPLSTKHRMGNCLIVPYKFDL